MANPFRYALLLGMLGLFSCQPAAPKGEASKAENAAEPTGAITPWPNYEQLDDVIGLNKQWTGDLDGIIKRRRLRVLVPYSMTTYYLDGTERKGMAYEAMIHFEQFLNKSLGKSTQPPYVQTVFVPMSRDQLIPALLQGYGDLIAENLTITPGREEQVAFSTPLLTGAREVVVTGPSSPNSNPSGTCPAKRCFCGVPAAFLNTFKPSMILLKPRASR
ncbi:MAG: transporter substrate-binding domain-containing protein [Haliscomenobacter sp.]|nr:transporter substrate-binding domain-containing protein [Haliscomenobacter sp.]